MPALAAGTGCLLASVTRAARAKTGGRRIVTFSLTNYPQIGYNRRISLTKRRGPRRARERRPMATSDCVARLLAGAPVGAPPPLWGNRTAISVALLFANLRRGGVVRTIFYVDLHSVTLRCSARSNVARIERSEIRVSLSAHRSPRDHVHHAESLSRISLRSIRATYKWEDLPREKIAWSLAMMRIRR